MRLAYPYWKILLFTENAETNLADTPEIHWSVNSDWMAVGAGLWGKKPELAIVFLPSFDAKRFPLSQSSPEESDFQALHDGSLAYIDDGKIYSWRPGYEEPVCIYDPGRATVLERTSPGAEPPG
jgi:hypothetical protein